MDRDLTLETHLLSRSYTSNTRIRELLDERYSVQGAQRPYLSLVPTEGIEAPKEKQDVTDISKNAELKPTKARKINTRKEMKVYIKKTLAKQEAIVKKMKSYMKKHPGKHFDPEPMLCQYDIPRYKVYQQLNQLWQSYMRDLLVGDQRNPNLNMILPKLATADYNGCELEVIHSRNRNLIGLKGIVLYDAQHSFIVVVPQKRESETELSAAQIVGGIRILPKRATLFGFSVDTGEEIRHFTIMGTRFELRAVDRSAKKFKSHSVEDIY